MSKCDHTKTHQIGPDTCFNGPVAVEPYTTENRVAHGNITYTEECVTCGARRAVNANAGQNEYGPFGESREQREAQERRQERRNVEIAAEKRRAADAVIVERHGVSIVDINLREAGEGGSDRQVLLLVGGAQQWIALSEIRRAARQRDVGDDLVPLYRGLAAMIDERTAALRRHVVGE